MARHDEYDRDKSEQGVRVAADIFFENSGYKEERLREVHRRASYAAKLRALGR
jgi:hypothetical protein